MLSKEGCLAKTLGKKSLEVSSRRLPDVATMERLKKQVEKLTHLKEEREQEMFAIKEYVIHNLEVLDLDLNTTSIEDMLIVDQEQFDSLRSEDIEGARKTLDGLRQRVEERKEEGIIECYLIEVALNINHSFESDYLDCALFNYLVLFI